MRTGCCGVVDGHIRPVSRHVGLGSQNARVRHCRFKDYPPGMGICGPWCCWVVRQRCPMQWHVVTPQDAVGQDRANRKNLMRCIDQLNNRLGIFCRNRHRLYVLFMCISHVVIDGISRRSQCRDEGALTNGGIPIKRRIRKLWHLEWIRRLGRRHCRVLFINRAAHALRILYEHVKAFQRHKLNPVVATGHGR